MLDAIDQLELELRLRRHSSEEDFGMLASDIRDRSGQKIEANKSKILSSRNVSVV
jgi:hypothetical protein